MGQVLEFPQIYHTLITLKYGHRSLVRDLGVLRNSIGLMRNSVVFGALGGISAPGDLIWCLLFAGANCKTCSQKVVATTRR